MVVFEAVVVPFEEEIKPVIIDAVDTELVTVEFERIEAGDGRGDRAQRG